MTTLRERALDVIPSGCLTRSKRLFQRWTDGHGHGALLSDVDGQERIDTLCALGARSLSNDGPGVYSLPHRLEVEAAEAVLASVAPWATWVRFTKTGSESTHAAVCIAMATTGRRQVIAMQDAYHGWFSTWNDVVRVPYGSDPETWVAEDIALVCIEPSRYVPTSVEWLRAVQGWCQRQGSLLAFDSMIFGGRWALGGASEYFGAQPDLETFGKALGGGSAVAFVVGTARTKPRADVASGTFSGDTVGLQAVIDTLRVYRTQPVIDTLWARGRQLWAGLAAVIPSTLGTLEGSPVLMRVRWHDPAHRQPFTDRMLALGVIWHPDAVMPMQAHSEAQIDQVIASATDAVEGLYRR
jgi:glutamate-1-semialdehyde 2,1-aminomutase